MDNNTLYTILQRYFKALSYTGYVQLQDLQYLIVLSYIKDIYGQIDKNITDIAVRTIRSKCSFCNSSPFNIQDQEYQPIKDNEYSIDFFNINLSSDKVKLNIGQGSNIKSVTIPSATQSLAGVLSSNDKVVIGKINEAIDQNILIGGLSTQQSADTISIGYSQMNPGGSFEDNQVNLPLATQSKAGLLSKEDKYIIDNVKSDIAEAEIASFNKTSTNTNITLTLQSANQQLEVQLSRANGLSAGLVIPSDIDTIDKTKNLLYYNLLVDELEVTPTENTIELVYQYYDTNDYSSYSTEVILPAATTSNAGVMTASDKSIVNNANTLLSNSPLVDKLQFAVADNKRWLQYKNNGNSLFTGISMPVFAEKLSVIADYTLTGSTDCTINLLALDNSVIDSATIPVVNEKNDGVMSTSMYTDLINTSDAVSTIQESIESLNNSVITTYDVGYNSDSIDVNLLSVGNNPIEANIEAATTTTAGVMSAEDKQQLTNVVSEIPTVSDSIQDGIKQGLHYVVWKNQLVAMMKDGIIQYAPKGLIYTEADEPFSFTIENKIYNVEAGNQYTYLNIDNSVKLQYSFNDNTIVKKVIPYIVPSSLFGTFWGASNLEYIDTSNLDISRVTSLYCLFRNCTNLKEVDVSDWDVSNCTNLDGIFYGCSSLEKIDVSKWNTSKATLIGFLFLGCKNLKEVNVSNFDTSQITSFAYMFHACNSLNSINVSNFDTSKATKMEYMFSGTKVTNLDLSNFIVENVQSINNIFNLCSALYTLKFPNMGQLKADTDNNSTIDLSYCPLGSPTGITDSDIIAESEKSLIDLFSYDRVANGLTNPLTVKLSTITKGLTHIFTDEALALISARGYTIA